MACFQRKAPLSLFGMDITITPIEARAYIGIEQNWNVGQSHWHTAND